MSSSLVKSMINVYENYSYNSFNNEPAKLTNVHRSKSTSSLNPILRRSRVHRSEPQINLELIQIEQQVEHLHNNLNNYKSYNRESHIYYQNQIFFLLTDIINIDARDDFYTENKKSELIEILKRLNIGLNSRLPSATKNNNNFVDLPPPVMKQVKKVKENQKVTKKVQQQPLSKQESQDSVDREEEQDEEDVPAPSVKTLKKIWEKNIIENEKKKAKEDESVKVTPQAFVKLDVSSDSKYIPYNERFQKTNSIDIPESPTEMYEESVQVGSYFSSELNEDDNLGNVSPASLSDHSDDSENVYEVVNGDKLEYS